MSRLRCGLLSEFLTAGVAAAVCCRRVRTVWPVTATRPRPSCTCECGVHVRERYAAVCRHHRRRRVAPAWSCLRSVLEERKALVRYAHALETQTAALRRSVALSVIRQHLSSNHRRAVAAAFNLWRDVAKDATIRMSVDAIGNLQARSGRALVCGVAATFALCRRLHALSSPRACRHGGLRACPCLYPRGFTPGVAVVEGGVSVRAVAACVSGRHDTSPCRRVQESVLSARVDAESWRQRSLTLEATIANLASVADKVSAIQPPRVRAPRVPSHIVSDWSQCISVLPLCLVVLCLGVCCIVVVVCRARRRRRWRWWRASSCCRRVSVPQRPLKRGHESARSRCVPRCLDSRPLFSSWSVSHRRRRCNCRSLAVAVAVSVVVGFSVVVVFVVFLVIAVVVIVLASIAVVVLNVAVE